MVGWIGRSKLGNLGEVPPPPAFLSLLRPIHPSRIFAYRLSGDHIPGGQYILYRGPERYILIQTVFLGFYSRYEKDLHRESKCKNKINIISCVADVCSSKQPHDFLAGVSSCKYTHSFILV